MGRPPRAYPAHGSTHGPKEATADAQRLVDEHFQARASYWKTLYEEESLWGVIHQERRALAMAWIADLALAPGARVLEVGCGAGLLGVDLARQGFAVECIDSNPAMVDLARAQAEEAGLADRLRPKVGDAHVLGFEPGAFDLVVALGVVPFLHSPDVALREMARVMAPDGRLLVTSDNRHRLNHLLDPRYTPLFTPLKAALGNVLGRFGRDPRQGRMPAHLFSRRDVERLLHGAGLSVVRSKTLGFGPFTVLGRPALRERAALWVHHRLQALADRDTRVLRATGGQHVILACHTSA